MKMLFTNKKKSKAEYGKASVGSPEESTVSSCEDDSESFFALSDRTNGCLIHPSQESSLRSTFRRTSSHSKSVQFDSIKIHTHIMVLADNPSVSGGVPVGLTWKATSSRSFNVDEFEQSKPPARDKREMQLPFSIRDEIVRDSGASRVQMRDAMTEVKKIQESRRRSARDGLWKEKLKSFASLRRSKSDACTTTATSAPQTETASTTEA